MPKCSTSSEFRVYIRGRSDRPGTYNVELRPAGRRGGHGPSRTVGSLEEAQAVAAELEAMAKAGAVTVPSPPRLVRDLEDEFLRRKRESKSVKSVHTMEFYEEITPRMMRAFGSVELAHFNEGTLDAYVGRRLAAGRSPVTVQAEVDVMSQILNVGAGPNPARGYLVSGAKDDRAKEWLYPDEIPTFLSFCSQTFLPKAIAGIFIGMRRAEVVVCQWGDFDFHHDVVVIRNKPQFRFRTKFGRARSVPLFAAVKEYFLRRYVQMGRPGPDGLVFPTMDGQKYSVKTRFFAHATASAVEGAGIKRPVTKFHDLRRTFGAMCLEAGVSLEVVAHWLGHRSVDTTRKVYARISGRFSAEQMTKVGVLWEGRTAQRQSQFTLPALPESLIGGLRPGATNGCDQGATGCDRTPETPKGPEKSSEPLAISGGAEGDRTLGL